MEQSSCKKNLRFSSWSSSRSHLFSIACLIILLSVEGTVAYKNYTVGDTLGWYDNLQEPKINYQKWVTGKNFSLGDFLIFNTDRNHTVVQTYNITTYRRCDNNDAEDDDTVNWSAGEPAANKEAITIAVPLLKQGMTYFFSSNYDGEQCKHGQHFKVNVTHGQGLPESLKNPTTTDSPAPTSPDDDNTVPDTVIPSNFNNPTETGAVKESSAARNALAKFGVTAKGMINVVLVILVGLFGIFA